MVDLHDLGKVHLYNCVKVLKNQRGNKAFMVGLQCYLSFTPSFSARHLFPLCCYVLLSLQSPGVQNDLLKATPRPHSTPAPLLVIPTTSVPLLLSPLSLFGSEPSLLTAIGASHLCWLQFFPVPEEVLEALMKCQVASCQICLSWLKVGRCLHGFHLRDENYTRKVALAELTTSKGGPILAMLNRGAVHEEGFALLHCTTCKAQFHLHVEFLEDYPWRKMKFRLFVARDVLLVFLFVQTIIACLGGLVYFLDRDGDLRNSFSDSWDRVLSKHQSPSTIA